MGTDFGVSLTAFNKDIRNLLGVEVLQTIQGQKYGRYINRDYGFVRGITLEVTKRHSAGVSATIDYTYQVARGNASDPNTAFLDAQTDPPNETEKEFVPLDWDRTHQYCGRCGTKTIDAEGERAKRCPNCGLSNYPRLSPSIIVRINRGDEILMARAFRFPPGMYSVLAGFVEPGETLEEAVEREVWEEVRIRVKNIRYFGSQPWPFPHSLMLGFTAEYAGGEIEIDQVEIEDAGWYSAANLPQLPPRLSIARRLIDDFRL